MSNPFFSYQHVLLMVHLLSFGILYGTLVWHSFIAGIIMFKNLPKRTFGDLQTALFPPFFIIGIVCGSLLLISGHSLNYLDWESKSRSSLIQLACLCTVVLFSALQWVYIGPRTTEIMMARRRAEDAKDEKNLKDLSKRFGMWHGISSSVNLAIVIAATVYAMYFVQHIKLTK